MPGMEPGSRTFYRARAALGETELWSPSRCTPPAAARWQLGPRMGTLPLRTALTDFRELLHAHCRYSKEGAAPCRTSPRATGATLAQQMSPSPAFAVRSSLRPVGGFRRAESRSRVRRPMWGPYAGLSGADLGAHATCPRFRSFAPELQRCRGHL